MTIERWHEKRPRPYVLIGVGPKMDDVRDSGEVWTSSRRMLMRLCERMDYDRAWSNMWPRGKATMVSGDDDSFKRMLVIKGFAKDMPWLVRKDAEEIIRNIIDDVPATGIRMPGILQSTYPGLAAERIFNLLVQDKVIKHPTARAVRGFLSIGNRGRQGPLNQGHVWTIDPNERDSWFAARLLILPERWP